MALAASIFSPSTSAPFRVKVIKPGTCQLNKSFKLRPCRHLQSPKCFLKGQSGEPKEVELQVELQNIVKENLNEAVVEPVKNFPWKEAESAVLNHAMLQAKKALKWAFIPLVIFGLSDFIFAVSKNKELMVPLGLFVGCSTANLLREILQEFFSKSEVGGHGMQQELTVISCCFFLFAKFASMMFPLQARVFLLHVGNGGLMQVLWQWRNSPNNENQPSTEEEAKEV